MDGVALTVRERVAVFGSGHRLVGIQALPTEPRPGTPHVVLLSTGIHHRVGSNRLTVLLARALGASGVPSLRFDLSGIGDSERRAGVTSLRESVERDIGEAVDYLVESTGENRFVLMGACSGAFDALRASRSDPRVVGVLMVDLHGPFQGWRHTLFHLGSRLFRMASWRSPLRKLAYHSRELVYPASAPANAEKYVLGGRSRVSREWMEQHLAALLDNGVQLFFIFTAGLPTNYNHRSQFRAAFPQAARDPGVEWDFLPQADHTFSRRADREHLVELAVRWMATRRFPTPTTSVRNGGQA